MGDPLDQLLGQRRLAEAEQLVRQEIQSRSHADGPESLSVAQQLARLAFVLEEQTRFDEAESCYEQALAIREKLLGTEHPDLATNLLNLGRLLNQRGKSARAADLLRRAVAVYARAPSPDEQFLLGALNSLVEAESNSAQKTGNFTSVTNVYAQILSLCEKSLSNDAHALALTLHNLGEVCRRRRQFSDADQFLSRALALRERVCGPTDSATLNTLGTLAAAYNDQGRYGDAEPLLRRVLDAAAEHEVDPGVQCMALNNLGFLCERQGRGKVALNLYRQALTLAIEVHGRDHPLTLHLNDYVSRRSRQFGGVGGSAYSLFAAVLAAGATWFVSLFSVIAAFGGGTEMWPAFVAAVPAALAGLYVYRRIDRSS